ncbi:iron complex outermembrane receptor protein [Aquimarina sp. EL_43]|uniref:TonB-dependent receptor n=1 Tax=Aquimarina TaxID=290174 RepID=UPI000472EAFB|nr:MULTISPECIES: TonB-dependent receptor [Aquimarina]MBG6129852.1 iron complex outermembrane receptor protein [Aquimarina sp. EL_35]MBG6150917.1 iron complex outermembrane receptor protein [Aquimarina sp. EL_32]MBG6167776.1 iron complex outermembrane receptor protein [Aquimarina sp. EL_43]
MKKITLILFCLFTSWCFSQQVITGTVTDSSGSPLPYVNIIEKGSAKGTTTDNQGNYSIAVDANAILVFSFIGFETQEIEVGTQEKIDVTLLEGESLSTIIVVGSRSPKRTATDTPVAIDIIDMQDIITKSGKIEINELLQYTAPSFNANKQSGSDGADHIDPATLRGLGPDQTLVLINGKRRHSSSLINVFGTRGRGNSGTDLNAIPASAIKRIEVLRDGAAAQYGSDAIAGVINIVLKDNVNKLTGSISYGAYNANAKGDFPAGTPNTDGNRLDTENDGNMIADDKNFDGGSVKITANYGVEIGERGYANFTTEYLSKHKTLRPGFDFRRGFGEAAIDGFNFFANAAIPISEKTEIYAFGGRNYRDTDAFAFTRNDGERVIPSIYSNGFTPRITSNIIDNSVSAGVRTETKDGWKIDINNTWGKNNFHYFIKGTLNASLQGSSPTDFDAGGHSLSQNTTSLDLSRYYPNILKGLNIAFGTEYRTENFVIFAGEEGSYATYDVNGLPITDPANQTQPTDPLSGELRPGGSQGFPGYSPANEVDRSRSNLSIYADAELDISDSFLLGVAGRFEEYSDFGSTTNGKLAFRIKATEAINIRGSVSTGFRAPSLAQIYYNLRFTDFQGGIATETLLSANNSPVTASFGIDQLDEETALNGALGATATFGGFTATVDGYYINVKDRIVLTGTFAAPQIPNVAEAQFFANGVDTETIGLDLILSWKGNFDFGNISATLAGNINNMTIEDVNNGSLDEATFFGEREKAFLLASAPESKFAFNANYSKNKFNAGLGLTHFSEIVLIDFADTEDVYGAKITADLNLGYKLTENLKFTIGGNNIFNEYPDQQNDGETEAGGYWDAVQMGFGGAYYYARLDFNF